MKFRKFVSALAFLASATAFADKEFIDGYTWSYSISGNEATVTGCSPLTGNLVVPTMLGGVKVGAIGAYAFADKSIQSIEIPNGVHTIGGYAFCNCYSLKANIPASVKSIGTLSFCGVTIKQWDYSAGVTYDKNNSFDMAVFQWVRFMDSAPVEFAQIQRGTFNGVYSCRREYGSVMAKALPSSMRFGGYLDEEATVEIVSSGFRQGDPTIFDVVYRVNSSEPKVRVRALAYKDGKRSLSNVLRPVTFVDGTGSNLADDIVPGKEYKISWNVAADWSIDLAKVSLEVIVAGTSGLVPLELMDLEKNELHDAMQISYNALTEKQVFNALLWLIADGAEELVLTSGVLKNGSMTLASGTALSSPVRAVEIVFSKMGYSLLTGLDLAYAKSLTRIDLQPDGVRQYAMKPLKESE